MYNQLLCTRNFLRPSKSFQPIRCFLSLLALLGPWPWCPTWPFGVHQCPFSCPLGHYLCPRMWGSQGGWPLYWADVAINIPPHKNLPWSRTAKELQKNCTLQESIDFAFCRLMQSWRWESWFHIEVGNRDLIPFAKCFPNFVKSEQALILVPVCASGRVCEQKRGIQRRSASHNSIGGRTLPDTFVLDKRGGRGWSLPWASW